MGPFYAAETRKPSTPYRPSKPIPAWLNLVLMFFILLPMFVAMVAWECVGVRIVRAWKMIGG
jgi:1-acyl-sn-glycerol-3-phosphate acyltransferase